MAYLNRRMFLGACALALTVDDGTNTEDVAALGRFCADTGMQLTFFVNGVHKSWTMNAPLLQPMVSSGRIQLGNHTWSHPDITRIGPAALSQQIGTITLWSAEIGDSRPIDEAAMVANAQGSFQGQQIVLAHANLPPISHCLPRLADIITARGLQTVTLNDVFS
jgi:hypothetical protein